MSNVNKFVVPAGASWLKQGFVPARDVRSRKADEHRLSFLDLPPEVRNRIYKEIGGYGASAADYRVLIGSILCYFLGLTMVCLQIRFEFRGDWLKNNAFVVNIDGLPSFSKAFFSLGAPFTQISQYVGDFWIDYRSGNPNQFIDLWHPFRLRQLCPNLKIAFVGNLNHKELTKELQRHLDAVLSPEWLHVMPLLSKLQVKLLPSKTLRWDSVTGSARLIPNSGTKMRLLVKRGVNTGFFMPGTNPIPTVDIISLDFLRSLGFNGNRWLKGEIMQE